MAHSDVSAALIAAYRATEYRCGRGRDAFVLRIGTRSPALMALYASTGCTSGVFISACNPRSEPQSDKANRAAHARLGDELALMGRLVLEGAGVDPTGEWRPEPSYLVLGVEMAAAQEFGRRYQQNAVVWVGTDAVPELVLLR